MTVNIPKEDLLQLYVQKQIPMKEIGIMYNVDRTTIANKLKLYNIPVIKYQRKFADIKKLELTDIQKNLIIGSVLGDASIVLVPKRKTAYFRVNHCEKQLFYLNWKKNILNYFVTSINKTIDKRGNSIMYSFNTISSECFNYYRDLFYVNCVKTIKDELFDYLSPLSLGIWFMDDGSCIGRNRVNYRLSTDGFSGEDNYKLRDMLASKFGIESQVLRYIRFGKFYYYLFFTKENSIKMTEIIERYMVECMKYKLMRKE